MTAISERRVNFDHAGVTYSGRPGERVDVTVAGDTYTLLIPESTLDLPDAIWEAANRKARERARPANTLNRRTRRKLGRRLTNGGRP